MQLSSTLAWLVDAAGETSGADRLLAEVGARLVEDGLPLAGGALTLAVPHPLIARRTWLWRAASGEVIGALGVGGGGVRGGGGGVGGAGRPPGGRGPPWPRGPAARRRAGGGAEVDRRRRVGDLPGRRRGPPCRLRGCPAWGRRRAGRNGASRRGATSAGAVASALRRRPAPWRDTVGQYRCCRSAGFHGDRPRRQSGQPVGRAMPAARQGRPCLGHIRRRDRSAADPARNACVARYRI